MNELKLVIEQTGQSYTLKPNREYIIGSGSDCDISLPYVNVVANQHLKLSFEQFSQTWHAIDLGSSTGTFVNNQQINDYPIKYQTRIALANGIFLIVTPSVITPGESQPNTYQPQTGSPTYYQTPPAPAPQPGYSVKLYSPTPITFSEQPDRKLIREYFECLKKRNEAQPIDVPVGKQVIDDWIASINEQRSPKEGIWVYIFLGALLISLMIHIGLSVFVIILAIILYNNTISRSPTLPEPPVTDEQIRKWVLYDRQELIKIGKIELNIGESEGKDVENILDGEPIVLLTGVNIADKKEISNIIDAFKKILIAVGSDYFCEKGLDRKLKYSIYDFIAIYPCKNFIAYYRCKYNFIKGTSLDDETCEYLYDSIVSIKHKEISSSNVGTNKRKEIYLELIEITTTDSQSIQFPVFEDTRVVDKSDAESAHHSKARDAAYNIRQQVRQRKPGLIKTQALNEITESLLE